MTDHLAEFIRAESLPDSYAEFAQAYAVPLANWMLDLWRLQDGPLLLGMNGAQGTGKTTLCRCLAYCLRGRARFLHLSLDDFYLGKSARAQLAADVHPLLQTRGVPGTHDLALLNSCLDELLAGESPLLPVFSKAIDDRLPEPAWLSLSEPVDIIVLEGWCIGASPQPAKALTQPQNDLEKQQDKDGSWRVFVNEQLAGPYSELFARLQRLIFLQAPSFESVHEWRELQESKLRSSGGEAVMSPEQINEFIQHYERVTRDCLIQLSRSSDYQLSLNSAHSVSRVTLR